MPGKWEIVLLPEGEVHSLIGSRGNYHQFEDGSKMNVHARPIWCRQCQAFTEGERIEPLETIDQRIAEYSAPTSEAYQWTSYPASHLADWRRRRIWRESRVSPPKCLDCSSTDIEDPGDGEEIKSPCSPGTLKVGIVAMCSTPFRNRRFTPEGSRIFPGSKPTR